MRNAHGATSFRPAGPTILLAAAVMASGCGGLAQERPAAAALQADSTDQQLLRVVEAALKTAAAAPAPWPGYDASSRGLVVYRVGRWALLLNPHRPDPVDGWAPYPASWPALSRPAWIHPQGDPSLLGQLVFDYEVAGERVVAVPLYDELPAGSGSRDLDLYAFLVHEAFHQFQRCRFSDVDTPAEETYPMLDPIGNALAGLELRALEEAVEAMDRGDRAGTRQAAVLAVAVHEDRMERLDGTARAIERSKEVVEGTAKYVETRAVAAFSELCREDPSPALSGLCRRFGDWTAARWLADDFRRRIRAGAIPPTDMPRNRIYATAAAVAFLLDAYDPEWKTDIEAEGTARGLFAHLADSVGSPAADRSALVDRARERYGWEELLAASHALVAEYMAGFDQAMAAFEAEAGTRVVIRLQTSDVTRSRSSREPRWVLDGGRRTLGRFVVYTLRRSKLALSIENRSVLDEMLADGYRVVTFHVEGPFTVLAGGQLIAEGATGTWDFETISWEAEGAAMRADLPGTMTRSPGGLSIDLPADR